MSGGDDETVPALARGVKFRFDEVRQAWVLLAPERLFVPDEQAVEILKLVDGIRSLGAIVDELTGRFKAPRDLIARDVATMLGDLADKGAVKL
ncbi:MAG TPA: pyrroloquinoline quinone biosynthesis peptide chaperone PqqD [Aliidongia sp.]|uniref:pyrroloquinoline quinone biosynthesis peptide chaperone PqqD n=1 Tax=Aliidongia sp. TaxID=1914230 RepID=UPI002DDC9DB9|nr:pyrroloquinoline quinone biosynthesis peptide chaperone PqqD [Aliidongia sp.]HEV2677443.1 pyrroloquinoline quinone biosynthesis peptide chaperone PqqD [Aliidongia sp.]